MGRLLLFARHVTGLVACVGTALALSTSRPPPTSSSSPTSEIRLAQGRRCRVVPAAVTGDEMIMHPPLVLLGGMAQSLSAWDHQLPFLSRNRQVVIYECLGQGPGKHSISSNNSDKRDEDGNNDIDNDSNYTLPRQAEMFWEALDELLPMENDQPSIVDMAGFSFGGRVAMAAATLQHGRVRTLHVTGVALDRNDRGHLAVQSFSDILQGDASLRSFAWSILLATYAPSYLRKLPANTMERFLHHICENNSRSGLLHLLRQAEICDTADPWHVTNMADRMDPALRSGSSSSLCRIRICVGELDDMAPVEHAKALSDKLMGKVDVLPGCGHAVVVEAPHLWRESILSLIDHRQDK